MVAVYAYKFVTTITSRMSCTLLPVSNTVTCRSPDGDAQFQLIRDGLESIGNPTASTFPSPVDRIAKHFWFSQIPTQCPNSEFSIF